MRELPLPRNLGFVLIAGVLLSSFLSACSPALESISQPDNPWATALRMIDLADSPTPSYDITAVYMREHNDTFQIRIDLLDFKNPKDLSLDIRIADDSVPEAIPLDIHIPSEENTPRITLDPMLATVIVEIPLSEIPNRPRVDISTPEDEITGLTLDGPVPTQSAPLLLTFYDTFAGRFPAEALRSLDGAHTGPRGERHGLKHLLDAVEDYQVPVVLLELKEPENLSALDAMGVFPQIDSLKNQGLLILPENDEASIQFVQLEDTTHIYTPLFSSTTYLPIAAEMDSTQPTPDGPSLEVRRELLEIALNSDDKDLLVLGGNFKNSTWGSPDMVGPTLTYFASRPYIKSLTEDDLTNFPTKLGKPDTQSYPSDEDFEKLQTHYQNLTQPVLEFADNWNGSSISNCDNDIDNDEQLECVLSSENHLAILDPQGARLTYLFAREGDSLHQLIGPSWQVAVGLSNPSAWDLSVGEAADPGAYPGAFTDMDDPFKPYEPTIEGNTLILKSLDGTHIKTFKVSNKGLDVKYKIQDSVVTQIPLLVDPWIRFTPGWVDQYVLQNTPGGIAWGLGNGPMVNIRFENVVLSLTKGDITLSAFNDSLSLLETPEDPDFDYPPGHYIPFPMAVLDLEFPVEVRTQAYLNLSVAFP
jgi:hypothetical protein